MCQAGGLEAESASLPWGHREVNCVLPQLVVIHTTGPFESAVDLRGKDVPGNELFVHRRNLY